MLVSDIASAKVLLFFDIYKYLVIKRVRKFVLLAKREKTDLSVLITQKFACCVVFAFGTRVNNQKNMLIDFSKIFSQFHYCSANIFLTRVRKALEERM